MDIEDYRPVAPPEDDLPVGLPEDNLRAAPPAAPQKTWVDRLQALFEVILLAGLASSILAALPFTWGESGREALLANVRVISLYLLLETAITFLLLWLVMRAHRETLVGLGLRWQRWRSDLLLGLALVPVLFGVNILVSVVFQVFFPKLFLDHNPLTELIRTPQDLGLFIAAAWLAGGIKEEVQRAFILRRFQTYLGGAGLGLVIWSINFGLGHYVQGVQGMVTAGALGLIFGIAYLVRGNLIVPIIAHGAYDTVALLSSWFFSAHR
jgi:membrane protease YdiL (CAAX protease family)